MNRIHTEMKSGLLLDVVVRESPTILKLLASEDETLLVWRDALLVLDLRLDVVDRVRRLDLKRDCLAGQRLHEDLHTATKTEAEVESGLLDIVAQERVAILELFTSEDQTLSVVKDAG